MGADAAMLGTAAGKAAPAPAARRPSLTRSASLTAAASLLDYAVKIVISLVVTPILVTGLGRTLFGIWEMLARLGSYVSATDGRPTEALRLIIAQRQADPDVATKRHYVGAALVIWTICLPLVVAFAAVLFWIAPILTKAPASLVTEVQLTCGLIAFCFMISSLGTVPESVLRGENLGYKRMGVQSGLNILGGALAVAAVSLGLGISGLAGSQIIRAVITALLFALLVKRYVPWFGADKPSMPQVKELFGMSAWLTAGDAVAKIMLASDVIILGAAAGPAMVTTYALTGYAARTAIGIHVFAAGAAIPGLGGVLGSGQMVRAAKARAEMLLLTWLFVTVVGSAVLVWNKSFMTLWVGAENYAGLWPNLLIILVAAQTAFIRTDAYIIDAALKPKARVVLATVAAAVTIVLSITLARSFGITGLCAGMLLGRTIQSVGYPLMARTLVGNVDLPGAGLRAARLLVVTAVLFTGAVLVGEQLLAPSWLLFLVGVPLSVLAVLALALSVGPGADARAVLLRRLRSIKPGRRRP